MNRFFKHFAELRIKTKLEILGLFLIFSLVVMAYITLILFNAGKTLTMFANGELEYNKTINSGIEELYQYRITGNHEDYAKALPYINRAAKMDYVFARMDSIIHLMPREKWIPFLFDVYKETLGNKVKAAEFMGSHVHQLARLDDKKLTEAQGLKFMRAQTGWQILALAQNYNIGKSDEAFAKLTSEFGKIHSLSSEFNQKINELSESIARFLKIALLAFVILLGTIIFSITSWVSGSISRPVSLLTANFKKIAVGNLKSAVLFDSNNEIGELSNAFSKIQVGLLDIVAYSQKVATGDFSTKLDPKSDDDELTVALNKMAEDLETAKEKTDSEIWTQNGLNAIESQMRGNFTVRELSSRIIAFISDFLQVEMGAVYVYDDVLGHLELTGSIGLVQEEVSKFFKPGEGLIGNAALSKSLSIHDTEGKYRRIFSATGELEPSKIYLFPMFHANRIQAVLELSPVNELSEASLEFLEQACERISINLNAAVARFRHKEMLDKTLEQAAVLQLREEELNAKLLEIQAIQEKLSREKTLLDAMLRTLPDYVYFKDTESKFLRISQSMVKLFNAGSAEEIVGKSDFDFHPAKDARRYFEEEMAIISEGKGFIDSIRQGIDENGDELWTSVTKLPMYDDSGVCIGTFGISKDVTKIKKLEVEVKKQNDSLILNQEKLESTIEKMDKIQSDLFREKSLTDALLENIPDSIYFKDLESRFIQVSKSMLPKFAASGKTTIIGLTDFDIQDSEHARQAFDDEQEIIRTGQAKIGYIEKETKRDGTPRYVLTTKMPYYDGNGNIIGTFGISRDITQIKQLELEIKGQNEILHTKQEELSKANNVLQEQQEELQAQQEELKTINEELKSQEEELRVANEELAEQTKILTESEKSLQHQQEELRVANEELELKTSELEIQKKEISEKNESLMSIQSDLKQKAKELEMASQYKSEFLANMSHELRTPLNSLLILSKLLANNKNGNLSPDQLKSVNIIYKSGSDLLELINEILDLSKIEAGKMTFEFNEFVIEDIKTDILHGFKALADNKGLALDIVFADKLPKTLYSDRQRFMQIMKNLLSNAFKFTNSGGIKVTAGIPDGNTKFTQPELNSNNSCYISVQDTGVGIPQNKLEAIFEAFKQADGSISRKFGGTGLGLSISRQLIRALGGEIQVTSKEGVGSVFTIFLPTDRSLAGKITAEPGSKDEKKKELDPTPTVADANHGAGNRNGDEKPNPLPDFIDDDRESLTGQLLVLIIHPDKEKAKKLLDLCHARKTNAIIAKNIADGVTLAARYLPKAIILSDNQKNPEEFEQLMRSQATNRLPVHIVTKIEANALDALEELKTPESEEFLKLTEQLSGTLNMDYNQILVVEDDPGTLAAIHALFEDQNIIIHEAKNGQQAYDMIAAKPFDCIILDLGLPDFSGQELLNKLKSNNIPIPNVIIHTARELSNREHRELQKFSDSIVIKGIKSDERLMDEVSLFLHQVSNSLPKHARPPQVADSANSGFKGKKILLVDDDIRNIFAIAQILEEKEIEVLEAENGEMALNILKENKGIDLILMDIMMPVMDGYETMRRIREIPGINHIPIITLTAKAMKEDYQRAIDHGANDYISKPVDIDKLISLLKIWLFK